MIAALFIAVPVPISIFRLPAALRVPVLVNSALLASPMVMMPADSIWPALLMFAPVRVIVPEPWAIIAASAPKVKVVAVSIWVLADCTTWPSIMALPASINNPPWLVIPAVEASVKLLIAPLALVPIVVAPVAAIPPCKVTVVAPISVVPATDITASVLLTPKVIESVAEPPKTKFPATLMLLSASMLSPINVKLPEAAKVVADAICTAPWVAWLLMVRLSAFTCAVVENTKSPVSPVPVVMVAVPESKVRAPSNVAPFTTSKLAVVLACSVALLPRDTLSASKSKVLPL